MTSPVGRSLHDPNPTLFTAPPVRAVLDHLGLSVVVIDLTMRVVYLNREAIQLLGYTVDEAYGRAFDEIVRLSRPSPNLSVDSFHALGPQPKGRAEPVILRTRNGGEVRVLLDIRLLECGAENMEWCVITIRELSREPPTDGWVYLGVASHELRTPLTALRWGLELLLEGMHGPISPEQKELIGLAYEGTLSMVGLVEDVLDASRIEEGRLAMVFQEVSLPEMMEDLRREFRILADRRSLHLRWKIPLDPLPMVRADPERLRQVVRNLVSNAIKYTPKGGTITVALCQEDRPDGGLGTEEPFLPYLQRGAPSLPMASGGPGAVHGSFRLSGV